MTNEFYARLWSMYCTNVLMWGISNLESASEGLKVKRWTPAQSLQKVALKAQSLQFPKFSNDVVAYGSVEVSKTQIHDLQLFQLWDVCRHFPTNVAPAEVKGHELWAIHDVTRKQTRQVRISNIEGCEVGEFTYKTTTTISTNKVFAQWHITISTISEVFAQW